MPLLLVLVQVLVVGLVQQGGDPAAVVGVAVVVVVFVVVDAEEVGALAVVVAFQEAWMGRLVLCLCLEQHGDHEGREDRAGEEGEVVVVVVLVGGVAAAVADAVVAGDGVDEHEVHSEKEEAHHQAKGEGLLEAEAGQKPAAEEEVLK